MMWGLWFDLATGLLVIGSGVFVLLARRSLFNAAFGVFSLAFGLTFVTLNAALLLPRTSAASLPLLYSTAATISVSALLLPVWGLRFPRPPALEERRRLRRPGLAVAAAVLAYLAVAPLMAARATPGWIAALGYPPAAEPAYVVILTSGRAYFGFVWGLVAWWALRYWAAPAGDAQLRRQAVLGVVALSVYALAFTGSTLLSPVAAPPARIDLLAVGVLAGVWLWAAEGAGHPRTGRNVALYLTGVAFVFGLGASPFNFLGLSTSGLLGLSRAIGLLVLAYGILRHQLFDIDLKLKWTLRKSPLALVVTAAFFVGNQLLEDLIPLEGTWLGLIAAAAVALLFQPIQGVADRMAERLMPRVERRPEYLLDRKVSVYRAAFEAGHASGGLSPKERAALDRLRADLGITQARAVAVERDVERLLGAG